MQPPHERVAVRLGRRGDSLFLEFGQDEAVDVAAGPAPRARSRRIEFPDRLEGPVPRPDHALGDPPAQCLDRRRVELVLSHRHPHRRIRSADAAKELARVRISRNDRRLATFRRRQRRVTVGELQASGCEPRSVTAEAVLGQNRPDVPSEVDSVAGCSRLLIS